MTRQRWTVYVCPLCGSRTLDWKRGIECDCDVPEWEAVDVVPVRALERNEEAVLAWMKKARETASALEAALEEARALRESYIAHRLAAAILLGTATSEHPEYLTYAEESCDRVQPPHLAKATKELVADVRRYDEGTAAQLAAELRSALVSGGRE